MKAAAQRGKGGTLKGLRFLGAFVVCVGIMLTLVSSAWATHNRSTELTWAKVTGANEVEFTINFVARRSYYGEPNVGETISDPFLEFGDGSSVTPALTVVAIGNDIIYTEAHVVHTYAGTGPYRATMGSCCRLSASSGHVNNGDLNYSVHTTVDLARGSASPRVAVAPIVFCRTAGVCSFAFAGTPSSPGNHLRWRFATPEEAGDPSFGQPGPPYAPNAATVDPAGRMTWDTTGATMSPSGLPTYYSTQVVAEEVNSLGEEVSDAAADFFIALDNTQTQLPDCDDTDGNGSVDNDRDGLCDNWETTGIDGDDDGNVDLTLPGAAPNRPDIYVEVDYMEGRQPQAKALADVTQAFAEHGIALHAEIGDQVPFSNFIKFDPPCSPCGSTTINFDDVKAAYFGTAAERGSANAAAIREARRFAYHYALYANELIGLHIPKGTSGISELPGNDLTVTLGEPNWRTGKSHDGPPTVRTEAGTFMHELGHNLGLQHGGGDGVNCKPNYISIMNYTRQTAGIVPTAALDYSEAALPSLRESDLNEHLGVQGPPGVTIAYGPGPYRLGGASGSIDWDWSGGLDDHTAADVNFLQPLCNNHSPGETLVGYDDWANLVLPFQATADFSDGVHSSVFFQEQEVSGEDLVATDSDGDGVPNIQDNCPSTPGSPEGGCPASTTTPSGGGGSSPSGGGGGGSSPSGGGGGGHHPLKCKSHFKRKKVKGTVRCVKVQKHKHHHHHHRRHQHRGG